MVSGWQRLMPRNAYSQRWDAARRETQAHWWALVLAPLQAGAVVAVLAAMREHIRAGCPPTFGTKLGSNLLLLFPSFGGGSTTPS